MSALTNQPAINIGGVGRVQGDSVVFRERDLYVIDATLLFFYFEKVSKLNVIIKIKIESLQLS